MILTDRAVTADPSLYVGFIGSDFVEEGRKAGALGQRDNSRTRTADVNIVELQGTVGSAPANDRKKGFEEIIAANPHFKIIRSQSGDFTRAKGKEVMEAFLKAESRKIHVLYAHNDDMAIGAIQAIEEAGLKPGKEILIVSIDAVKGAFEAMIAGKLNATIECNPVVRAAAHDFRHRSRRGPPDPEAHRRGGSRCSPWKRRSSTSSRASTDATMTTRRRSCSRRGTSPAPSPACRHWRAWSSRCARAKCTRSWARTAPASRTLIKVLTGVYAPDAGSIELLGQPVAPNSPMHAQELGISAVHQESHLLPNLSVAENICAGRYPRRPWTRGGGIDWRETERGGRAGCLPSLGIELDVTQLAGGLPAALQQLATVARAVATDARVLILDEPTSSLDADEVQALVRADPPAARQGRRHPVRHAFPRPGVRDLRPHDRAAQRQVRR